MTKFLLPVPTHTVGTDLITVQYDRQMIPILTGLLNDHATKQSFDPSTGNPVTGRYYIDTLVQQLLTEVELANQAFPYIRLYTWSGEWTHTAGPTVDQNEASNFQHSFFWNTQASDWEIVWPFYIPAEGYYRVTYVYDQWTAQGYCDWYIDTSLSLSDHTTPSASIPMKYHKTYWPFDVGWHEIKLVVSANASSNRFFFTRFIEVYPHEDYLP